MDGRTKNAEPGVAASWHVVPIKDVPAEVADKLIAALQAADDGLFAHHEFSTEPLPSGDGVTVMWKRWKSYCPTLLWRLRTMAEVYTVAWSDGWAACLFSGCVMGGKEDGS